MGHMGRKCIITNAIDFPSVTSNPAESNNTAAIVGSTISVIVLLLLLGVVVFFIWYFWIWRKKGREEVDSPAIRMLSAIKRSGVAGLYVDTNHIYYSCTEINETSEKKYMLRKCNYNGELVKYYRCNSFVRGIGQSHGFIYVLCSGADSQVVKLNRNLNHVGKETSDKCGEYFGEAFGMLVTSDNVLVCSERNEQICVLNLNLEFCYNLELKLGPVGIATFQNHYIVTAKATIGIIDIDFDKKALKRVDVFESMTKEGVSTPFNQSIIFRGVCCSDKYIYVTQKQQHGPGLPMLCLQFDEKTHKLNYICEVTDFSRNCDELIERCGPVVPFYHNNTIFYSQGSYGIKFHIMKATHNPGEPIASNKMFDVL
ncbi:hypothetical protein GBAR_LOCUS24275 [Geodia barretti]|uniref:Uncharacterized protein n=1 Tax=Geodia barretti TaxID=519541 RepID=A0AA35X393_GEOBA|nr:hypothetical protein GBAR_LOCUS24275 [Geodia barretti]